MTRPIKYIIQNNLEKVCKQKGITLYQLAQKTGIIYQNIYKYAARTKFNHMPRIDRALHIADILGVTDLRDIWKPVKPKR